jgi:hypothetical protein
MVWQHHTVISADFYIIHKIVYSELSILHQRNCFVCMMVLLLIPTV